MTQKDFVGEVLMVNPAFERLKLSFSSRVAWQSQAGGQSDHESKHFQCCHATLVSTRAA